MRWTIGEGQESSLSLLSTLISYTNKDSPSLIIVVWDILAFQIMIRQIRKKNGVMAHLLEYIDYPDQKLEWIKVYQKLLAPGRKNKSKSIKRQLMVRPWFPTICHESERPDISTITGAIVIVDNAWKVGDLVDWWADGCYWSGRVAEILDNGKVKIDLLPPPMGEGLTYEAFSKDIRPSLDWCPEKSWTVPIPMLLDHGKQHPSYRLIKPEHSEDVLNANAAEPKAEVVQTSISTSLECSSSHSSQSTEHFLDSLEGPLAMNTTAKTGMELELGDTSIRKTDSSNSAPSSHIRADSAENVRMKDMNGGFFNRKPSKKIRKDKSICLDSMFLHSIEDKILDLEELVNRVKWMRGILEFGMPLSSTNQSFWEFWQHDAP